MFPNDFNVYLHDTPDPHLFDRVERDFSHGCVRVSRPADLAHYLLEPDGWSRADVVEAMDNPERRVVYLSEAVPVHLHYMTTFVNEEGAVQFRDDLYGYDAKHIQARQREWTE
jgi:L,D-transpeptidase YcbB